MYALHPQTTYGGGGRRGGGPMYHPQYHPCNISFTVWNGGCVPAKRGVARRNLTERHPVHGMPMRQTTTKKPRFDAIYRDFERMKQLGIVLYPDPSDLPEPAFSKFGVIEPGGKDELVTALKIFVWRDLTTHFDRVKEVLPWYAESKCLLDEALSNRRTCNSAVSVWNTCPNSRRQPSANKSSKAGDSDGSDFRIDRFVERIKLSPYPGEEPSSSNGGSTSGNDRHRDTTISWAEMGRLRPIGIEWKLTKEGMDQFGVGSHECVKVILSIIAGTESDQAKESLLNDLVRGVASYLARWPLGNTSLKPAVWLSSDQRKLLEVDYGEKLKDMLRHTSVLLNLAWPLNPPLKAEVVHVWPDSPDAQLPEDERS